MIEDVREPDKVFSDLMNDNAKCVRWNRNMATKFLEKANHLEAMASRYRELSASLILEAAGFAEDTADLLLSEFPLESRDEEEEDDD